MPRKRKFHMEEVLEATERLLLEYGYDQFHFKMLSEKLNVARSTIYEYFSSKEELIKYYMENLMEKIFRELDEISNQENPLDALEQMFTIFLKYAKLRKVFDSPNFTGSNQMQNLLRDLQKIYQRIYSVVEEGKWRGFIRNDIPSSTIATMFFYATELPGGEEDPDFVRNVYSLLKNGFKNIQN